MQASPRQKSLRGGRGAVLRTRRRPLGERWLAWRRHHSQSAADSLARVLRDPVASIMTWLVLGIAIALPAGLELALTNLERLGGAVETSARLSVFLVADASSVDAQSLASELTSDPRIEIAEFLSRDAALRDFRAQSGLDALLDSLPGNPLPHIVLVTLAGDDVSTLEQLANELYENSTVEEVIVDTKWVERFRALMDLGRKGVLLLAVVFVIAMILALGNTIRLTIESRREEIVIVKLVGGTDAFVRRPMLYMGLWYGLGGGVVAAVLLGIGVFLLSSPVGVLADAYNSDFQINGYDLFDALQLILVGTTMGLIGAWIAVARHIKNINPD
ncbi:MAG: permease-like cell division protein FtsX [Pseudomonadota bacterium]